MCAFTILKVETEVYGPSFQEIGDVENWAKSIETDMRTISSALEYAYRKSKCCRLYWVERRKEVGGGGVGGRWGESKLSFLAVLFI